VNDYGHLVRAFIFEQGACQSPSKQNLCVPSSTLFFVCILRSPSHLYFVFIQARGMNYLHHSSSPIIHRDLKSSNLLVDKHWTVKVQSSLFVFHIFRSPACLLSIHQTHIRWQTLVFHVSSAKLF